MKSSDVTLDSKPKALARVQVHLEWQRLERAVMARCRGTATQRHGLPVEDSLAASRTALSETAEVMTLLAATEPLPIDELRDVAPHAARLKRGGSLDGPGLADVRVNLRTALDVRRFIGSRRQRAPALDAICHIDPSLDTLEDALAAAVGSDGNLHDDASPELRRLRAECANLRARIIGRLEQFIEQHKDLLSDRFHTVREGRYVVPVRSDAHERVPGIVHATSDSGASVFVEPRAVVTQGNRLKMAHGELAREEARILASLSGLINEQLDAVTAAIETLERYDLRMASARLCRELDATVPELLASGAVTLRAARHPLLELDGVDVVANDVVLASGHGVVVSGPNAGGKTVLLRTLGLFALMVRAGLPIPAAEGSSIGFFAPVLSDLGDEQSTQHNLSTFSAHITSLASILSQAAPQTLVLLDEICGGTDPEEGAALACAVVDALCSAGATVLVTTHYEALKAFSLQSPTLRSASVGFDLEHMLPNFALTMDVPGASSALQVAARFGIPKPVLAHAERVLPEQAKDFDTLVRKLQSQAQALHDREAELRAEVDRAQALRREHQQRLQTLKERSQRKLTLEADKLMSEVRQARELIREAKTQLRKADRSKDTVSAVESSVSTVATRVAVGGDLDLSDPADSPPRQPSDDRQTGESHMSPPAIGEEVYVTHLRSRGTVVECDGKTGRVRVAAGPLKLWAELTGLRKVASPRPGGTTDKDSRGPQARATGAPEAQAPHDGEDGGRTAPIRTRDNTISLRGMRVDDALPMMETFIDRLLMGSGRVGYVLHGHGTGALRKAVREHLQQFVSQVTATRPGTLDEGGDAVTVFYLG